jgi:putative hydrolase of the HAD superfamily
MKKKCIILDLDNTIYPVHAIGDRLFEGLFRIIENSGEIPEEMGKLKQEIMRRPFQWVAQEFRLSSPLTNRCIEHLKGLTYEWPIDPFDDYRAVRNLEVDRYLVTTGFKRLQESKIDAMGIRSDFLEIHIVDPAHSVLTKKDVFADIMQRHGYSVSDVLVVGDDLHSEIRAGRELGLEVVLYDKLDRHEGVQEVPRITNFQTLKEFL